MPTPDRQLRVFLCHASQDKPVVRDLHQRLNAEGWIDPWLDEEKLLPGQDWDLEIEKAVEAADAVVVCLSNNSVTREGYIQKELRSILDVAEYKPEGAIFIIPLRLEECTLPRRLRNYQYQDYFPPDQIEKATRKLHKSLKSRADLLGINIPQIQERPQREHKERIRREEEDTIRTKLEERARNSFERELRQRSQEEGYHTKEEREIIEEAMREEAMRQKKARLKSLADARRLGLSRSLLKIFGVTVIGLTIGSLYPLALGFPILPNPQYMWVVCSLGIILPVLGGAFASISVLKVMSKVIGSLSQKDAVAMGISAAGVSVIPISIMLVYLPDKQIGNIIFVVPAVIIVSAVGGLIATKYNRNN